MMVMEPYAGFEGNSFTMPPRNVVPKPMQKPHPPLWLACSSRETIKIAARYGMGALTFAFIDPASAAQWVEEYYDTFQQECRPIGRSVNPNIAIVAGFMLHGDSAEAERRGGRNFQFFGYALSHFYITGSHLPGRFDLWQDFQRNGPQQVQHTPGIGNPEQLRNNLEALEAAGVDQVVFVQQAGNNRHEHICDSLELFANQVMPAFKERHELHRQRKAKKLEPAIERAMQRIPSLPQVETLTPLDAYPVQAARDGLSEQPQRPVDGDNIVTAIAGKG